MRRITQLIGLVLMGAITLLALRLVIDSLEQHREEETPVKTATKRHSDGNAKAQTVSPEHDMTVFVPAEPKSDVADASALKLPPQPQRVTKVSRKGGPAAPLLDFTDSTGGVEAPEMKSPETADTGDTEGRLKGEYIKIGCNGERLGDDAERWACVEDTRTGLMWEVKSAKGGLHHPENLFSWYQPEANEGFRGVEDAGRCEGMGDCDTRAYVRAVNVENYCGYSDWRLPTRQELLSLVKAGGKATEVTIDSDYFPQTLPSWYWTGASNESDPEYAWYLLFRNGVLLSGRKGHPKHLRLVRSEIPPVN